VSTTPEAGHNSEQLKSIIERAERIEERRKEAADDMKDLMKEADGQGLEPAAIKLILKERAEDAKKREKRERKESVADVYRAALGMLSDTPLGQAAIRGVA
jgi:uncharacterized protein (UPF0335 family)